MTGGLRFRQELHNVEKCAFRAHPHSPPSANYNLEQTMVNEDHFIWCNSWNHNRNTG